MTAISESESLEPRDENEETNEMDLLERKRYKNWNDVLYLLVGMF
jgi:hypothetical protein